MQAACGSAGLVFPWPCYCHDFVIVLSPEAHKDHLMCVWYLWVLLHGQKSEKRSGGLGSTRVISYIWRNSQFRPWASVFRGAFTRLQVYVTPFDFTLFALMFELEWPKAAYVGERCLVRSEMWRQNPGHQNGCGSILEKAQTAFVI